MTCAIHQERALLAQWAEGCADRPGKFGVRLESSGRAAQRLGQALSVRDRGRAREAGGGVLPRETLAPV